MRKILLLLPVFGTLSAIAQDDPVFDWARTSGGLEYDTSLAIKSDAQGNVYSVGSFNNTFDFNPGAGTAVLTEIGDLPDAFVQKYDANGNFLWAKKMGGQASNLFSHIQFAPNGDLIVIGSFGGTVDFDPNAGTANLSSVPLANAPNFGSTDVVFTRLTPNGAFIWAKKFGGAGYDEVFDSKVDADGNLYLAGFFEATCDFDPGSAVSNLTASGFRDGYIAKFNADGDLVWAKRFGGTSETRITGIELDASGNIYGVGQFFNAIDVDPGTAVVTLQPSPPDNFNQYSQDVVLLKLNADGEYQWAGKIGGQMGDSCSAIALDENSSVFISGSYVNSIDMDPSAAETVLTPSAMGGTGIFVAKYGANGGLQWAKTSEPIQNPQIRRLRMMPSGDLAMAGIYASAGHLSENVELLSYGNQDAFVARLDAGGNYLWANSIGGTQQDEIEDLHISQDGIWHLTGSYQGTTDLNPFAASAVNTVVGYFDFYLIRLAPEGLGTENVQLNKLWSVFPNPSEGEANLKFEGTLLGSKISIHTILGQKISEFEITNIDMQVNLNPGNYVLKLENGNESSVKKLIVM